MHNYSNRLARIEQAIAPVENRTRLNVAYMNYDDSGSPATIEICGRTFSPLMGEMEDAFLDRAKRECAAERLLLVRYVKAANGKPSTLGSRGSRSRSSERESISSSLKFDLRRRDSCLSF